MNSLTTAQVQAQAQVQVQPRSVPRLSVHAVQYVAAQRPDYQFLGFRRLDHDGLAPAAGLAVVG